MGVKPLHLLSILLFNILAVVVTSNARSATKPLVELTDLQNDDGGEIYLWRINKDEERRLTDLLQHDFYDVGMEGTLLNSPPHVCSHCGKETEFVDWVYTALERGIHSPEFIVESLKLGNSPKGVVHDVYCSRCGHLTAFRNPTGDEGGMWHISYAPEYDRATHTFAKREDVGRDASHAVPEREADADEIPSESAEATRPLAWGPGPKWIAKREKTTAGEAAVPVGDAHDVSPPSWHPHWVRKRAPAVDVSDALGPPVADPATPVPHVWPVKKRGGHIAGDGTDGADATQDELAKREKTTSEDPVVPVGDAHDAGPSSTSGCSWTRPSWFRKRASAAWVGRWNLKRGEHIAGDGTDGVHATQDDSELVCLRGESVDEAAASVALGWAHPGRFSWSVKRDSAVVSVGDAHDIGPPRWTRPYIHKRAPAVDDSDALGNVRRGEHIVGDGTVGVHATQDELADLRRESVDEAAVAAPLGWAHPRGPSWSVKRDSDEATPDSD